MIREFDFANANDENVLRYLKWLYDDWDTNRAPWVKHWEKAYKLWKRYTPTSQYPWRSKLFVPELYTGVQTMVPRAMRTIFGANPWFHWMPVEESDIEKERSAQLVLNFLFERNRRLKVQFSNIFRAAFTQGVAFVKEYWDEEDYLKFHLLDWGNCFADPQMEEGQIQETRGFFERGIIVTDAWMKEMSQQGIYSNVEECLNLASYQPEQTKALMDEMRKSVGWAVPSHASNLADIVTHRELMAFWSRDWHIILDAERNHVLLRERNPLSHKQIPFHAFISEPEPLEPYGVGKFVPNADLQFELNDLRNQRMDNVNLILNTMWVVDPLAGFKEFATGTMTSGPGRVFRGRVNGIQQLFTKDVTSNAYAETAQLTDYIQRALGINDYIIGQKGTSMRTATEVVSVLKEANIRFGFDIQIFVEVMEDILRQAYCLARQYLPRPTVIRLQNKPFPRIDEKDFAENFDIRVNLGDAPAMSGELEAFVQLYGMLRGSPNIDLRELERRLLIKFGERDIENLFNPLPQGQGTEGGPAPATTGPPPEQAPRVLPNMPPEAIVPPEVMAQILTSEGPIPEGVLT